MPYFNPIKFSPFEVGDLVAIVIGQTQYVHGEGAQAYLECHVGEVFSVGEYGRLKAVRFAVDGSVVRRRDLHRLITLNPSPASQIDVPAAMAAARAHGKPFESLEALRNAVRQFRLDAPHDPATCPECAEQHEAEQAEDREAAALAEEQEDAAEQTFVGRYLLPADRAAEQAGVEPVVSPDSVWLDPAVRTAVRDAIAQTADNDETGGYEGLTDAELDGTACISCTRPFAVGEGSEPITEGPRGTLFAHIDPDNCAGDDELTDGGAL